MASIQDSTKCHKPLHKLRSNQPSHQGLPKRKPKRYLQGPSTIIAINRTIGRILLSRGRKRQVQRTSSQRRCQRPLRHTYKAIRGSVRVPAPQGKASGKRSADPPQDEPPSQQPRRYSRDEKQCSICGKDGHEQDTCPRYYEARRQAREVIDEDWEKAEWQKKSHTSPEHPTYFHGNCHAHWNSQQGERYQWAWKEAEEWWDTAKPADEDKNANKSQPVTWKPQLRIHRDTRSPSLKTD
mgnify:CR=1 FL=1